MGVPRPDWPCTTPDCDQPRQVFATGSVTTKCRGHERADKRAWSAANRGRKREADNAWVKRNPGRSTERYRTWRAANPGRALGLRRAGRLARAARKAGVLLVVKVDADHCGVCLAPLTGETWPHPMSTTVGHEPPLSVAERDGWLVVAERPEHWSCNQAKGARTDAELRGAPLRAPEPHFSFLDAARAAF
jgi:hypothetical protein